ncbi:protein BREAKING OF ASYMMETRY IN THE STOMATAL LINEAGE [Prosopis cineraria]|uniref:protein BREAKING OF ASYMMETRY IN THE STOMATAL LINEAGE n=1 Tax=Prosopis cineraria TaxID=364024 RepID=UPI002410A3C6|nr:protein BREAKING OF ASYMMETRY IN THE STOMATAL LINEAGE [Prosopis cineraria]
MCTTWTMARFVRWRVRDWASCFLPLDGEPASSPPMAVDKRNDNRVSRGNDKKLSQPSKKYNKKRETKNRSEKDKTEASPGHTVDDSSWSPSADEDYIVFCFRDDGAFDVIKDGKCVKSELPSGVDGSSRNSRPVNRKLKYGEDAEQVSKQSTHDHTPYANQNPTSPYKQDEERDIICKSGQQKRDNIKRACQVEKVEDRTALSSESRDSNQSEGSTGSFAFPVLGWEWMGSPVQLPRSESMRLSKQKVRFLRFQCCRF